MRPLTIAGARVGVLLGLVALMPAAAGAGTPAPTADVVLVKVAPSADAGDRAAIARRLGAEGVRSLPARWRAHRLGDEVTRAQAARAVAGLPAEAVELDQRVELAAVPNDPLFAYQRHLSQIGAPRAWDLVPAAVTGSPAAAVTVAVIDSGLDTGHPDIAGRLWVNTSERDGVPGVDDDGNGVIDDIHGANLVGWPYDGDVAATGPDGTASKTTSHGTHVAGLIGAATDDGVGIAGVAPNAEILAVRFLSGGSGGGVAAAIEGIEYARRAGARVINMSWTLAAGATSQALCDAVAAAGADGIVMVAAAGNGGGQDLDHVPVEPASCPSPALVAVAATDVAPDQLAAFSNVGARTVDLAAPGTEPPTLIRDDRTPGLFSLYPSPSGRPLYMRVEGTSMAAPLVSGAAALMMAARPGLTPVRVGALLRTSGVPRSSLAATTLSGRRLDLHGAVAAASGAVFATERVEVVPVAPDTGPQADARPRFRWSSAAPDPVEFQLLVDGRIVAAVPGTARDATPAGAIGDGMHTWRVQGTGVPAASPERPLLIDTTPPAPLSLAATASPTALVLTWGRAVDATSGVAGLRVERGGATTADLGPDATGHTLPPVPFGATETIAVVATDRAGNATRTEVAVTGTAPIPASHPAPPVASRPAAPAAAPARGTPRRVLKVAAKPYVRRYEVRARVTGGGRRVIARGRLAARARAVSVRLPRGLAAAPRLSVRTARMETTSRRRTVRVGRGRHVRRYAVWAHDVTLRRQVGGGRLAPGRRTIVVRLPRAVAAVGPRISVTIRATP